LPPGAIGFTRSGGGEQIVVLANLSPAALAFDAGLAHLQPLHASGWQSHEHGERDGATLAPYGWMIGMGTA
jgi:hypothetical protein